MVNLKNLHLKFGEKISRKSFDNSRENFKLNKKFIQGHKMNFAKNARENGQVAILTVVMFMLLFSVLVVSFTRIMVAASHETQSDELKAQALAAAESGIEDAKRILTYCMQDANKDTDNCKKVLSFDYKGQNCDTIINTNLLAVSGGTLKTEIEGTGPNKQVKVGDANSVERYLCLKIATNTLDYSDELSADGKSEIILLDFVNSAGVKTSPAQITIQWHLLGDPTSGADSQTVTLKAGSDLPSKTTTRPDGTTIYNWPEANPAAVRAEFVKVPICPTGSTGCFTVQQLADNARAVTIRPSSDVDSGGSGSSVGGKNPAYNLDHWQQSSTPNAKPGGSAVNPPLLVKKCAAGGTYACSASFTTNARTFDTEGNKYYLRLQAIYHKTSFTITATDASGNQLYFNGQKPEIDVTGRAVDAFQRVKARVEPVDNTDPDANWFPEYAIDTGGKVCKNLSVTAESGTDNCTY